MEYGVLPIAGCGATYTDSEGLILSPGYPSNYGNNLLCNYTIVPDDPQATTILTFDPTLFRVEGDRSRIMIETPPDWGNWSLVTGNSTDNDTEPETAVTLKPPLSHGNVMSAMVAWRGSIVGSCIVWGRLLLASFQQY